MTHTLIMLFYAQVLVLSTMIFYIIHTSIDIFMIFDSIMISIGSLFSLLNLIFITRLHSFIDSSTYLVYVIIIILFRCFSSRDENSVLPIILSYLTAVVLLLLSSVVLFFISIKILTSILNNLRLHLYVISILVFFLVVNSVSLAILPFYSVYYQLILIFWLHRYSLNSIFLVLLPSIWIVLASDLVDHKPIAFF